MVHTRKLAFFALPTALAVYLFLLFPYLRESIFTYDIFYNVWRARKIVEDPLLIFAMDVMRRFCPLYIVFLFLMDHFIGFNPHAYGLINISLHFLNAFLLYRLLRRLIASSKAPAILASIFFLFSSTQWGVLWETGQTHRLICASLSLSSLLFFVRLTAMGRKRDWVLSWIFFVNTFGFCEDAVTLPLLLLAILFFIPLRRIPLLEKIAWTGPFFLVSLGYTLLSFSAKGPQGWGLTVGTHVVRNLLFLTRELVQFLLIPRPEFIPFSGVPANLLRLLPVFFIFLFAGAWWRLKKDQTLNPPLRPSLSRSLLFGIAWIGITSLLYALRPMNGAWQGRYLYIPGMGEAIGAGVILFQVGRSLQRRFLRWGFLGILFYGFVLNVSTTLLMVRKARGAIHVVTREEAPLVFSITSSIRDRYGAHLEIPPDMILVVEGLPLTVARLKELLLTYYASLPAMIIEAQPGQPVTAVPRQEKYRILYMKWENQRLSIQEWAPGRQGLS